MRELIRLAVIGGFFVLTLIGWATGGYAGAAVAAVVASALLVVPWRGQPAWSWAMLYLRRSRAFQLNDPVTVANGRSGGGVRYQDGVAVAALQLLGKPYEPTIFTGSTGTQTANTIDISDLLPYLHQSLGLTVESISVVSAGARRRAAGDYPRVYDTLIGTPPYAGRRETWLLVRIRAIENGDALMWRSSAGTAVLAVVQRIAVDLRCRGIRARVGSASDLTELEGRLGCGALEPHNRRWNSVRGDAGWHTTYAYRPADISTELLAQAWALRADGVTQNVTIFPNGRASATVTVRTGQPLTAPPSVALQSLHGEQAAAIAANLCGPLPEIRQLRSAPLPGAVVVPIGPSGVLLGKTADGDRLLLPLDDPGEQGRVHIIAGDPIAKRILIRAAAAGERITVHSRNLTRWDTVRMPNIAVVDHSRPASGTTLSVIDGTVSPAPRPHTVVSIGSHGTPVPAGADVVIIQTGPSTVAINAGGRRYDVEVEFFRAENLYVSRESTVISAQLQMAE